MGSVRFGIPRELALSLAARHGINLFCETGTLVADTAVWAAGHFLWVSTVDIVQNKEAVLKMAPHMNIMRYIYDSAEFLEHSHWGKPCLFWLDAHTNESCPVLREIAAINRYSGTHTIMVDDARLFDALTAWPRKADVIAALENGGKRTVWEVEDVIVAEPCP
jgi:hypothetical protein